MASQPPSSPIDRTQVSQLIEKLELDLAQVRAGTGDLDGLHAEIAELRSALAEPGTEHDEITDALEGLHKRLGSFGDELFGDALTSSHYIAWMGRILGL